MRGGISRIVSGGKVRDREQVAIGMALQRVFIPVFPYGSRVGVGIVVVIGRRRMRLA